MRRHMKWVFAFLAIVFAGSFVFLGVGSSGSALTDFLNGNIHLFGSGGGPSEKSLEKKVAKDPTNAKLQLQLAQLFSKNNHYDHAIATYNTYLKLKPTDTTALNDLGNVYASKVQELQSAVQSPPTPPLAAINNVSPISTSTTLGTAISTLTPTEFSSTSLQAGETKQLQAILNATIQKHVNVYLDVAKLSPGDSSAFLAAPQAAVTDGNLNLAIVYYRQFLKKFPSDPLVPDIKKQIKSLQKQIASGTTPPPVTTPTLPGSTSPTG
jgi:tetratricopeptide (TPR) repeat protein